jgi:hypothetical protein
MLLFALWIGLGAVVGSLVGIYRCNDIAKNLPQANHTLHIGFCAGIGAIGGFLVFVIPVRFFYGLHTLLI